MGGLGTAVAVVAGGIVTETLGWAWIGALDLAVVVPVIALVPFVCRWVPRSSSSAAATARRRLPR